jgi:hypothetical protein
MRKTARWDWTVAATVAVAVLFVWILLDGGCAYGGEPSAFTVVNRVPPTFTVVNRVKASEAPPAPSPDRVVIVPGRWEYGADGLWRFYPSAQPPEVRQPLGFTQPALGAGTDTSTTVNAAGFIPTRWTPNTAARIVDTLSGGRVWSFDDCGPRG